MPVHVLIILRHYSNNHISFKQYLIFDLCWHDDSKSQTLHNYFQRLNQFIFLSAWQKCLALLFWSPTPHFLQSHWSWRLWMTSSWGRSCSITTAAVRMRRAIMRKMKASPKPSGTRKCCRLKSTTVLMALLLTPVHTFYSQLAVLFLFLFYFFFSNNDNVLRKIFIIWHKKSRSVNSNTQDITDNYKIICNSIRIKISASINHTNARWL